MNNAEKFKEVFGFEIDDNYSICNMLDCARCPFHWKNKNGEEKDQCTKKADSFWLDEYKDGNLGEYTRGLNDAWECTKKIFKSYSCTLENGHSKYKDLFGEYLTYKAFDIEPSEAIAKIKAFEESEKRMSEHRKLIKDYIAKYGKDAFDELVNSIKEEEIE